MLMSKPKSRRFRSSGMLEDILRYGNVPPHKWGTDIDIVQALGKYLTSDWNDIKSSGTYILPPVSLTEEIVGVVLPHQPILQKAIDIIQTDTRVEVKSEFAGIQKNDFSCMDYVVRGSLKDKTEVIPI
jgi:hypothetical protein